MCTTPGGGSLDKERCEGLAVQLRAVRQVHLARGPSVNNFTTSGESLRCLAAAAARRICASIPQMTSNTWIEGGRGVEQRVRGLLHSAGLKAPSECWVSQCPDEPRCPDEWVLLYEAQLFSAEMCYIVGLMMPCLAYNACLTGRCSA